MYTVILLITIILFTNNNILSLFNYQLVNAISHYQFHFLPKYIQAYVGKLQRLHKTDRLSTVYFRICIAQKNK